MNKDHGSPWDRGSADAWYGRRANPHKYPNGTYKPPYVPLTDWDEICDYMSAYMTEPWAQKEW